MGNFKLYLEVVSYYSKFFPLKILTHKFRTFGGLPSCFIFICFLVQLNRFISSFGLSIRFMTCFSLQCSFLHLFLSSTWIIVKRVQVDSCVKDELLNFFIPFLYFSSKGCIYFLEFFYLFDNLCFLFLGWLRISLILYHNNFYHNLFNSSELIIIFKVQRCWKHYKEKHMKQRSIKLLLNKCEIYSSKVSL